jgi:hypothetical protein
MHGVGGHAPILIYRVFSGISCPPHLEQEMGLTLRKGRFSAI